MWRNLIIQIRNSSFEEISASTVLLLFLGISSIHESNLAKHLRTYILGLIQEALNKVAKG
ncbi:hypothetical protein OROMI_019418 [Orobanche minor]